MKFAAALLVLGFVAAVALAADPKPAEVNPCANVEGKKTLKNPQSGEGIFGAVHCMTYTSCNNKTAEINHCFGWPLLPIRQYSPVDKKCEWFWQVNCTAVDA